MTAIELLPVFSFDPADAPPGRDNVWGYSPLNWFTPHHGYCSVDDPLQGRDEMRQLVAACHDAGIEVLLDVVYNHTTEGNRHGPTLSWRGLADDTYYHQNSDWRLPRRERLRQFNRCQRSDQHTADPGIDALLGS